jgi:hypothetical protein
MYTDFMRKLLWILIFVIFSQIAEAKTILYITNSSTDSPCSSLSTLDALYCNRLTNLGYTVKALNELNVKQNSTIWNEYVEGSNMIFLGNVNLSMFNKSNSAFCGNISMKLENRTLFATFASTWLDKAKNIEGCAFYPSIGLVNFNVSDNKCSKKTLKVEKSGFLTEGYSIGDNIDFFSTEKTIRAHNISDGGWFSAECVIDGIIGYYPVINTSDKGIFWGLDDPSNFTQVAWNVFDKTIINALGYTNWTITAMVIPSMTSINQDTLILSDVRQAGNPVNGTVNFTADGLYGSMAYSEGFWRNKNFRFNEEKQYNLTITAYSQSVFRGSSNTSIIAGSLFVDILTNSYKPNSDFVILAKTYLGGTTPQASQAFYNIYSSTYTIISSGTLSCVDNLCSATIPSMPDLGNFILEVTASNTSIGKYGGNFKIIGKQPILTDKNVYNPGDTIQINFFPYEAVSQANLTIIRPDGSKETPSPIPMNMLSSTQWNKNYTLGSTIPNGTYIINVKTSTSEYNKSFDVIVWKPYAYLNKNSFYTLESLNLTVGATEVYSANLNISVNIDITDSANNKVFNVTGLLENNIYKTSYFIPNGYTNGTSIVKIGLKDPYNRSSVLYLNFSVNFISPNLFVTPSTISQTTIQGKIIEKNITIDNSANIDTVLFVNVSDSMKNIVTIVSKPETIQPQSKGQMKIKISTASLSERTYTGTIDLQSRIGSAQVSISLEIVGDLYTEADDKLNGLSFIENNITQLASRGANATEASNLLNEIKDILNKVKQDYKNENYLSAKSKLGEAEDKMVQLESEVASLFTNLPDYSYIVWDFAIAVVIVIVLLAIIRYRKKIKRLFKKEQPPKKEEKREEVYFKPKGGEYRTEYY